MEEGARKMRLASQPGEGTQPDRRGPVDPGLTPIDLDAARGLAEFHRLLAAELPPDSQVRGLVLRCAGHWSRLGAIPRNGLAGLELSEDD
jgi:hypothetical protein